MPRWNKAKILTPSGAIYHKPSILAQSLVDAGLAKLVSRKPLIVRLISLRTLGGVLIPEDCQRFLTEVRYEIGYRYNGGHRTRKPASSENGEYIQLESSIAQAENEQYVPLSHKTPGRVAS